MDPSARLDREEPGPGSDTWLVIPILNEEQVIGAVVRGARRSFANVCCVDDGSGDGSAAAAAAAGAVVIRHALNLGQGAALQTGLHYVCSDPGMRFVVTFDADGQHRVEDAVAMVARLRDGEADVVFGSRFLDRRTELGRLKRMVLRAAVAYTNLSTGLRLTDAHNGLRAMTAQVAASLDLRQARMAHASELVEQIARAGFSYREHPVQVLYTPYSRSKGQSVWNSVNILVEQFYR